VRFLFCFRKPKGAPSGRPGTTTENCVRVLLLLFLAQEKKMTSRRRVKHDERAENGWNETKGTSWRAQSFYYEINSGTNPIIVCRWRTILAVL
jgi:hypothetical protein